VGKQRRKPARPASVMSGYYADQAATGKAFAGGWFHSGDLTVWHPDVIIELRPGQGHHHLRPGEFGPLPKTSTGEVQRFVLSDRERAGQEQRIGAVQPG
jgi:hypothetical protein